MYAIDWQFISVLAVCTTLIIPMLPWNAHAISWLLMGAVTGALVCLLILHYGGFFDHPPVNTKVIEKTIILTPLR